MALPWLVLREFDAIERRVQWRGFDEKRVVHSGQMGKAEREESTSFSEEKEAKRLWRWGRWDRECR